MDEVQPMLDSETLQQLIALLPDEWRRHLLTAALLWPVFNVALWGCKAAVAKWVTSPGARWWFDAFFKLCDLIAINTKGMELRPMAMPKRKEKP
jgi:hypothetical protein